MYLGLNKDALLEGWDTVVAFDVNNVDLRLQKPTNVLVQYTQQWAPDDYA